MRMKLGREFEELYDIFANSSEKEDRIIRKRLEYIIECYRESEPDEAEFAQEITEAFSSLILFLLERHEKELEEAQEAPVDFIAPVYNWSTVRYEDAEELMCAFYNYYKKEHEVDYYRMREAVREGRKELVNPTMKDYVARIYTFGKKYLGEMVNSQRLGGMDPVLFIYEHIEWVLATFKTRNEEGEINKQRVNIRSALRKLNEFKQIHEMGQEQM